MRLSFPHPLLLLVLSRHAANVLYFDDVIDESKYQLVARYIVRVQVYLPVVAPFTPPDDVDVHFPSGLCFSALLVTTGWILTYHRYSNCLFIIRVCMYVCDNSINQID